MAYLSKRISYYSNYTLVSHHSFQSRAALMNYVNLLSGEIYRGMGGSRASKSDFACEGDSFASLRRTAAAVKLLKHNFACARNADLKVGRRRMIEGESLASRKAGFRGLVPKIPHEGA